MTGVLSRQFVKSCLWYQEWELARPFYCSFIFWSGGGSAHINAGKYVFLLFCYHSYHRSLKHFQNLCNSWTHIVILVVGWMERV